MTGCLTVAVLLSTCLVMTAATAQDRAPDYAALVAAPDRTEADFGYAEAANHTAEARRTHGRAPLGQEDVAAILLLTSQAP